MVFWPSGVSPACSVSSLNQTLFLPQDLGICLFPLSRIFILQLSVWLALSYPLVLSLPRPLM